MNRKGGNAITVNINYINVCKIIFGEFVNWENGAEGLLKIQKMFVECDCSEMKILVDLNNTVYVDALLLIQVFLYFEKAFAMGAQIEVELLGRDNVEHMRFLQYLMEGGYLSILDKYTHTIAEQVMAELKIYGAATLQSGNFESQKIIFPLQIINNESEIDRIIEEVQSSLHDSELDTDNISLKVNIFLQETLENVYEHAYGSEENKYCAVFICRKIRHKRNKTSCRKYLWENGEETTLNFAQFNRLDVEKNPYRIKVFNDTHADYLQIYILDIGQGILRSIMDPYNPKDERKLLNGVFFTSGNRRNRRRKSTQAGGLYMINNVFGRGADGLGIRSDYSWFPLECGKDEEFRKIKNFYVLSSGRDTGKVLAGFSIVGYLNIFGKITREYNSYFLTAIPENVVNIYKLHNKFDCCWNTVKIFDFRFELNIKIDECIEERNVIVLTSRDMKKNTLIDKVEQIIKSAVNPENLFIADFFDYELSKYFLIFSGIKLNVKNIYLISQNYSIAAFQYSDKKQKYNRKRIESYLKYDINNIDIEKNIYGYINCLIKYESALFWNSLNIFQKHSTQKILVNGKIKWNYKSEKYMTTYMDFSQSTFIKECREILLNQMFRLAYIHREKVYFLSADRFTEDICDLANAELGNTPKGMPIHVGSTYVTGTSSLEQTLKNIEIDDKWFYFFKHPDCEEQSSIATLLEWEEQLKEWSDDEMQKVEYERIETTPFIAQSGAEFFRRWQYENKQYFMIKMQVDRMYNYLQEHNSWSDIIFSVGHMDLEGPHDFMIFNIVKMFEKDRLESYTQPKLLDTSYDFLLCNFYITLRKNVSLRINTIKEDFNVSLASISATCEKVYSYCKNHKNFYGRSNGLLLYFTDYATIRIVRYFQKVFNDEINSRIIPLSLVNPKKGAASLLLSPLLLEGLQELIRKMKENTKSGRVTIFTSMIISTRLINELQHILYCLGAETVEILTFIDRQRLPFGYSVEDHIRPLWKMDIPPLGNEHNCILCNGIVAIKSFCEEIELRALTDRLREVTEKWQCQKSFTNNPAIITARRIVMPEGVKEIIHKYSEQYSVLKNLEITTDLGLVLFSVESMAVTQSLYFLDECLKFIEDSKIKILLLCSHLCLFRRNEMNERKYFELIGYLYDCLIEQESESDYSGLALIVIAAQYQEIIAELNEKATKFINNGKKQNIDAFLCSLFVLYKTEHELSAEVKFYFKGKNTLLEIVNDVFRYTCRECVNTHSGILIRMYDKGITLTRENYSEALDLLNYLKGVYERFPKNIINANWEKGKVFDELNLIMTKQKALLERCGQNLAEETIKLIFDQNKKFLDYACIINNSLFRASLNRKILQTDISKILEDVVKAQKTEMLRQNLSNVMVEWPELENDDMIYWYCFTKDIVDEISYLIMDFCYLKKTLTWAEPVTYNLKQVAGVIYPKFKDEALEIHFYNNVASDFDLKEYNRVKKTKESRSSIIRIKELFPVGVSAEVFCYKMVSIGENENVLDACLRIPYLYFRHK